MSLGSIKISRAHFPVTTLGFGRRVGLWVQGCSIRCPGCINPDTWVFTGGWRVTVEGLLALTRQWLPAADGITITGGEPFNQPAGLEALVQSLRREFGGDILAFSGYNHEVLFAKYPAIVQHLDVLITGPFKPSANQRLYLRGSDNQRVFLLSPKTMSRYPADIDGRRWEGPRHLDFFFDGGSAFMAGIPTPDFPATLRRGLAAANLRCKLAAQQPARGEAAILPNEYK